MPDIVTIGLAKIVDSATAEQVQRVAKLLSSMTSFGKIQDAVEANVHEMMGHITVYMAAFEEGYRERTGHGFDEISEEESDRFHRLLAGAVLEAYDEISPERLKILAAAIVGLTWGDPMKDLQSTAWKTIKQLEPAAVAALLEACTGAEREEWGLPKRTARYRKIWDENDMWLTYLVSQNCVRTSHTEAILNTPDLPPETRAKALSPNSGLIHGRVIYTHVTSLGQAVIKMLLPYYQAEKE